MALTASRNLEFAGPPELRSALANGNDTYYKGMILCYEAAGYLVVPSDAAALEGAGIFTGIAEGGVSDYAYVVASGAHPRLQWGRGKVWIPFSGAAITDVGDLFYLADDTTLTKTAGSKTIAYRAIDFKTGYIMIDMREPMKLS